MTTTAARDTASPRWPRAAVWSAGQAALAVRETVGLADLALVRDASAVVFRCGDHAVKVNAPGTDPSRMRATYDALRESTSCLLPVGGPYEHPLGVVTVWPWIEVGPTGSIGSGDAPEAGDRTTWPELGRLVRAFHDTAGPIDALPRWRPFRRLDQQLVDVPTEPAAVLRRAAHRLLRKIGRLPSELGHGLIHGDVSIENTLRADGQPLLIDLDFVAIGPREYDLVGALLRHRRGEIDDAAYTGFCRAYGADAERWPGLPVVIDVCDLGALTFELWTATHLGHPLPDLTGVLDRWR